MGHMGWAGLGYWDGWKVRVGMVFGEGDGI